MDPDVEALVFEHLELAQSLARQVYRTAPHALDLDDLRGIASLGLVWCAQRWKPYCAEKGHSPERLEYFRPFVVRRVRGALIDASRSADWATRSLRYRAKALQAAGQERGLSDVELAERSGMSVQEVRNTIRGMAQRPVSLEAEELDPEAAGSVESSIFTGTVLSAVTAVVAGLGKEEQVVLALHYFDGLQLQQVAGAMGISESRVSELHANAVLSVHAAMLDTAQHSEMRDSDAL
jgi:RNA polymerase sigma factor for flagellar operon FliA